MRRYTIHLINVTRPPSLSNVTYSVLSNIAKAGHVFSPPLTAYDREGDPVTYALSPSALALFALNATTGVLTLASDLSTGQVVAVNVSNPYGQSSVGYVHVVVTPYTGLQVSAIQLPVDGSIRTIGGDTVAFAVMGLEGVTDAFTASYSSTGGPVFNATSCVIFDATTVHCTTSAVGAKTGLRVHC